MAEICQNTVIRSQLIPSETRDDTVVVVYIFCPITAVGPALDKKWVAEADYLAIRQYDPKRESVGTVMQDVLYSGRAENVTILPLTQ